MPRLVEIRFVKQTTKLSENVVDSRDCSPKWVFNFTHYKRLSTDEEKSRNISFIIYVCYLKGLLNFYILLLLVFDANVFGLEVEEKISSRTSLSLLNYCLRFRTKSINEFGAFWFALLKLIPKSFTMRFTWLSIKYMHPLGF